MPKTLYKPIVYDSHETTSVENGVLGFWSILDGKRNEGDKSRLHGLT